MHHDAPPRGYAATVAALSLGQLLCWAALYYAFSAFVLPMQRETGWSRPLVMGAFTLGLAVWGLGSAAAGAAIDRGHERAVLSLGALLGAAGFVLWWRATQPWMLYLAWLPLGAAMAMTLYEPAFSVIARRHPERLAQGITTLTLVGGLASTLAFPAIALATAALGWRGALLVIAVLLCLVAPLHAWALRGPSRVVPRADAGPTTDATLRQALGEPAFWLLAACFTLVSYTVAALWAHAMPAFAAKGLGEVQAMAVLVWVGPAQVAGRLLYVLLARRLSLRGLGVVVLSGLPCAFVLLALGEGTGAFIAFAVLFGMANGLSTIVRGGIVPQYFGRAHVGRIGGAMAGIAVLARAAAPLSAAWLLLVLAGYAQLMLVLAAAGALAVLAFALAKPPSQPQPQATLTPSAAAGPPGAAGDGG